MTDEPTTMDPDEAFGTHQWDDVEGEARCVMCLTAPDWPLAVQPCRRDSLTAEECVRVTRSVERRPHITAAEIQRAVELREGGEAWSTIGLEMGRLGSVMQRAVRDYQAGRGRLAERERGAA